MLEISSVKLFVIGINVALPVGESFDSHKPFLIWEQSIILSFNCSASPLIEIFRVELCGIVFAGHHNLLVHNGRSKFETGSRQAFGRSPASFWVE